MMAAVMADFKGVVMLWPQITSDDQWLMDKFIFDFYSSYLVKAASEGESTN